MKIIHTADVHLDRCFAGSGLPSGFGNRRRQSLRDVFHTIVERAGAWPADALLIAGDLFEEERVSRDTVAFIESEFASIPHVAVCIAPGNHDPFTPSSTYAREAWPDNVQIFSGPEWTSHTIKDGQLTIHGFGFDGPDVSVNPFGSLNLGETGSERVHVAVAHGSERNHQPPEKEAYAPFDVSQAAVDGLAYLALGHFHALTKLDAENGTVVYYSGAPEGQSFRETGMHHYLEVEILAGEVHVTPVAASRMVYAVHTLACDDFVSTQDLIEAVRETAEDEELPHATRITLTGLCVPNIKDALGAVHDALAPDFEHLAFVDRCDPIEDYEEIVRDKTSLALFVRTLNDQIDDTAPEDARRHLLERARELGVAAFRQRDMEIHSIERR